MTTTFLKYAEKHKQEQAEQKKVKKPVIKDDFINLTSYECEYKGDKIKNQNMLFQKDGAVVLRGTICITPKLGDDPIPLTLSIFKPKNGHKWYSASVSIHKDTARTFNVLSKEQYQKLPKSNKKHSGLTLEMLDNALAKNKITKGQYETEKTKLNK